MTPLLLLLALAADVTPNTLTSLEREAGWRLAFDGQTLQGWHPYGRKDGAQTDGGWEIADGCLHLPAGRKGGDLVTDTTYGDFELELEWRVAPGANSGIKYRIADESAAPAMLGPEYQVLDDERHPDGKAAITRAASLYAVFPPAADVLRPAGEWNTTRIVARGDRLEHWLNGTRVVECTVGSPAWDTAVAASKFASVKGYGCGRGSIGLQDHGDEVWYRSIRVRDLEHLPGTQVELFDGKTLAGWTAHGDARYVVDDGCILGETAGGSQSFLVTDRHFGDFLFEVDLLPERPGNSGIQIRSHVRDDGRVFGYQVEIDSSDRAWSAGLYDEARRGWLDDLSDNEPARKAFRPGQWNHYRVECLGPWIRTWINGVPAADYLDPMDLEGFFGLQVHAGQDTRVRWKNFRLRDLGTRKWRSMDEHPSWAPFHAWGPTPPRPGEDLNGVAQRPFFDTDEVFLRFQAQPGKVSPDAPVGYLTGLAVGTPLREWRIALTPQQWWRTPPEAPSTSDGSPTAEDYFVWIRPDHLEIRRDGKRIDVGRSTPSRSDSGNSEPITFSWSYGVGLELQGFEFLGAPE